MNTFEITEKGEVLLHVDHQGNTPNSGAYIYFAFAKYALAKVMDGDPDQIFWHNGRRKWSLEELNLVASYMGLDLFFLSLNNNTGGAEFKYNQNVLNAISPWNHNERRNVSAYFPENSILELQRLHYNGELYQYPAFQKAGEEYYVLHTFDGEGGYTEEYKDCN